MDKRKEAKKIANKRYYEQTKAKLKELSEIKKDIEDNTEEDPNFFFRKNQKEELPPEVKPPPQIIVQAPPPVKSSLKNKVLETMVLSFIPMLPLILKQCINILQTRQTKSQQPTQEEPEKQLNMQYQLANSYDF